MMDEIVARNM